MIRVFLLGVLGLIALALVARNLPDYAVPTSAGAPARMPAAADDTAPFVRWEGVWEGAFVSRRPDGTVVETTSVRQEYTSLNPLEQSVVITDQHGSGPAIVSNGTNRAVPGGLECRVTDPNGITKVYTGVKEQGALFWHRRDPAAGIEEGFREEILALPDGDLYTVDGFGIYGANGGSVLQFEGRYRRVGNTAR